MRSKSIISRSAIVACLVAIFLIGCGKRNSVSSLPSKQGEAVRALQAANVKVTIRDGKAVYVDFYQIVGVPKLLVQLESLPSVETIVLSGTDVTDDSLVHLQGLIELKELALNYTKVTDKGVVQLAGLKKLTSLNLNKDNVTDATLEQLKNLPELAQLHLNETQISDAGIKHLAECKNLKNVMVYNTKVTPAGAEEFRKTHPDAEFAVTLSESNETMRIDDVEPLRKGN